MIFFLSLVVILTFTVALPSIGRRPWGAYSLGLLISFFGVVLPLFFFFISVCMVPDSKADAHGGGIGCFYIGKLALTPLVLWAMTAFVAVEIYRTENRKQPWIVLGFFIGAIVCDVCTAVGIYCAVTETGWALGDNKGFLALFLIVPIYTSVWYSLRAISLAQGAQLNPTSYLKTLAGSVPLWVLSIWWSREVYESLPQTYSPGCFVVTAATRGHRRLVGPFFEISRNGENRTANRQLLTFWQFEEAWRRRSPKSHALFRRIYNRFGPAVARRITRAWMADAIYLTLKPLEIAAQFLFRL